MVTLSEVRVGVGGREGRQFVEILTQNSAGSWVLSLPARMKDSQPELEKLLARAFTGRPRCQQNLELAQQLTLNWCVSKCKKQGVSVEEFFREERCF